MNSSRENVPSGRALLSKTGMCGSIPCSYYEPAYNLSPRATELLIGATMRRLVARASPGPRSEESVLRPLFEGQEASGGWLDRKRLPSAGGISIGLTLAGVTGLAVAGALALTGRRNSTRKARHSR